MESAKKKRVRSINFSYQEKDVLLSLVMKYKHIVENKKTDHVSVADKNEAWIKITDEFNAVYPTLQRRSLDSLKFFYDNKKKEVRKQVAEERKEIFLTGGGKKQKIEADPSQEIALSLMNRRTVFGLENPFDSNHGSVEIDEDNDKITEFELDRPLTDETIMLPPPQAFHEDPEEFLELDSPSHDKLLLPSSSQATMWKKASSLKTPLSESLKKSNVGIDSSETPSKKRGLSSNRRRPTSTINALASSNLAHKYNDLLDKRIVIADYEEEKLQNELEFQKEEHQLRLELLKVQLQLAKQKLKAS